MASGRPDEVIADSLARIRRDQQAGRLQRRAGSPAAHSARFRYLDALLATPAGRPISEIADAIGVDRPRASRLTTELLDEGLIERETPRGDGRYALIRLAGAGREVVAGVRENRRRAVAEALAGFTPDEARTLAELLERFVDAWPRDEPGHEPRDGPRDEPD